MAERLVFINPEKLSEYQKNVGNKLRAWYHEKWELVYPSYDFFRKNIADASFLAYLEYFLEATGDKGQIDVVQLESVLSERLGNYFSPRKFENAVDFFEASGWDDL